jgi:hypothetical protein
MKRLLLSTLVGACISGGGNFLMLHNESVVTNVTIEVEDISEVTNEDIILSIDGSDEQIIISAEEITYVDSEDVKLN